MLKSQSIPEEQNQIACYIFLIREAISLRYTSQYKKQGYMVTLTKNVFVFAFSLY